MNRKKRYRLMLAVAAVVWAVVPVAGADLHFVVLADTLEADIGTGDDLDNSRTWAELIAGATGLTLNYQSLSGYNLTISNARATLNALTPGSDDVVYLYYSGHGGNAGSKWPTMYFSTSGDYDDHVTFDDVVDMLTPKNPRALIVMTDCCNNYPYPPARPAPAFLPRALSAHAQENFQRLFVGFQGTVLVSGCAPGQFSLGGEGSGGLFTNCFMNAFQTLAETESILTWETVMFRTAADTKYESALYENDQEPQYEVDGGEVAGYTPENPTSGGGGGGSLPEDPYGGDFGDDYDDGGPFWDDGYYDDLDAEAAACGETGIAAMAMTLVGLQFIPAGRRRWRTPGNDRR